MSLPATTRTASFDALRAVVEQANLPGIVAAVFGPDGELWSASEGETASQYRIGSISKTFTAVAVLQLRELGLVGLEDPIAEHVPDAPHPAATVRQLLAHSTGMTAEPTGQWWERIPGVSWAQLAAANSAPVRAFAPATRFHYSNLGFALLGELVARHRSMSWYDAVRRYILEPLDLRETTYLPGRGAAPGTSRDPRTSLLMTEPAYDAAAMAPAGQLWSTLDDLQRWGSFLVTGSDDVLAGAVLREMGTAQSADPDTQHEGAYGLGLRLRWRTGSTLVGHTGSMPGFLAAVFTDSRSRVGAVVLTNATAGVAPEELTARLVDLIEPSVAATPTPTPTETSDSAAELASSPAAELAGEWYWGNTAMTLHPRVDGFRLTAAHGERALVSVEPDVFEGVDGYFAGERLHVVRRPNGSVSHLEVVSFVFTRVPYDPDAPIPGGLPDVLVSSPD